MTMSARNQSFPRVAPDVKLGRDVPFFGFDSFLRIAPDVKLGRGVRLFGFVNLYGCEIGDETTVGAFVEVQKGVRIGRRCKISSHSFICEGVTLEDEVFIGHNVTFTNDLYPRATNGTGRLQADLVWKF